MHGSLEVAVPEMNHVHATLERKFWQICNLFTVSPGEVKDSTTICYAYVVMS
jgi:hypothetical protein